MLLLTDNLKNGAPFQQIFSAAQSCTMVELDQALKHEPSHGIIACCATLDAPTLPKVRKALMHHRATPRVPVLFVVNDTSVYTLAQADALGATKTLLRSTPRELMLTTVRNLMSSGGGKVEQKGIGKPAEAAIREASTSLREIFHLAMQCQPMPIKTLEKGADALISSIRNEKIKDWLDFVRRSDDVTHQHSLLVGGLVAGFASRLGVSAQGQRQLAQAALVHDVGKAKVPSHILNKQGTLTPAETDLMRAHPVLGYDLLTKHMKAEPFVLSVVRHHHELLDGSGYPDRLSGGQIPDSVRLVTICDIFSALIERRPHRAAMPADQAYAIVTDMKGKLDPSLVKAFSRVVEEM